MALMSGTYNLTAMHNAETRLMAKDMKANVKSYLMTIISILSIVSIGIIAVILV